MSTRSIRLRALFVPAAMALLAGCSAEAPGEAAATGAPTTPTAPAAPAAPVAPAPSAGGAARLEPDTKYLKAGDSRTFDVVYTAKVKDIPEGSKRLRVWVAVPQDSPVQTIAQLKFEGPSKETLHTEKRFGNRLAYWEVENPGATFESKMSFRVTRKELITDLAALKDGDADTSPAVKEFLKDDALTFVDDQIREMASKAVAGKTTTLEKARALYDLVSSHMAYDKNHQGWGRGDTKHACEVGKGNCTDFHAMFMSLARASGIPAGFEIGLYMPYEVAKEEPLGGYHCWAFFRVPGKTWVPVDISEADRFPERLDYFFGSQTSNRVTLSTGRDLVLEPKQDGGPLNFLLNPYAEADGKPVTTSKDWTGVDVK